ncbi:pectin acetylesterase-family hydrolase [Pelagibaculum spongiae]|uniref:Pectin acetylesterase n=1 Tax=Pelagibaculum spongiae TaxID=2080658 RepID=A0A2V1GXU4_9GAMM|nr:pectin acetylesterase-family hydrolase [Pelagibaculum spongiae]PVZ71606.1 pectin acetylesterase [Pelagibaculum spongiae]
MKYLLAICLSFSLLACAGSDQSDSKNSQGDGNIDTPPIDLVNQPVEVLFEESVKPGHWQRVELADTYCGDGSQYKFFVNLDAESDDLLIAFQGGGACWDYESCTGQNGIRGAANPNGITDNFMNFLDMDNGGSFWGASSPMVLQNHPWHKTEPAKWNKVFLPYCTGDVFAGDKELSYPDPTGENPDLQWKHAGATNTLRVIGWLKQKFTEVDRMMTYGCSAGGVGALAHYQSLRKHINPRIGFMLNDSGPLYPAQLGDNSWQLHQKIADSWNITTMLNAVSADIPGISTDNIGNINQALAITWPQDRLAHTQFTRDANYSGYSYERFFNLQPGDEEIHRLWGEDQQNLMDIYDQYENMAYFIPYFRPFNESHCTSILDFTDTQITGTDNGDGKMMHLGNFINILLDETQPLQSHFEAADPAELERKSLYWELMIALTGIGGEAPAADEESQSSGATQAKSFTLEQLTALGPYRPQE